MFLFIGGFMPLQSTAQTLQYQDSPFGIHDPTVPNVDKLEDIAAIGAKWVRYAGWNGITWDFIESPKGTYNWRRHDQLYLDTYKNKIKIMAVILAYSKFDGARFGYLPKNMQWYLDFLAKAVERYDGDGVEDAPGSPVIDVWEVGNEEDSFWKDTPENYAFLLKESYKTVKKANPNAKVAFGGLAGPYGIQSFFVPVLNILESIKDSINDKYFEICGFHWSGQFPGNYQMEIFPVKTYLLANTVDQMKVETAQRGYKDISIWIGEMSYNDGKPIGLWFLTAPRTESEQAVELFKRYAYSIAKGVGKVFWITLTEWHNFGGAGVNNYFDNVGLINNPANDGQSHKKLAYYTYKKMVEVLEGSDWKNIATVQEQNGIYIYKFTKQGTPIWVAWNDSSVTRTITISGITQNRVIATEVVPKYESGKDVADYATAFRTDTLAVTSGAVMLTLGQRPVFVEAFTVTSVEEESENIPKEFVLYQNYPNPFNPTTTLRFSLPQREHVSLKVFDVLGREVATLVNEELNSGEHLVDYNAKGLPSGVYFYRLSVGGFIETKKMLITK